MAFSRNQVAAIKKKLEETEKAKTLVEKAKEKAEAARDEAEQHGYDVGVAKTEDALRAKVPNVCRAYCDLVWDEALNQAGVEPSSILRKPESIYYPPAIRLASSSDPKADPISLEAGEIQGSQAEASSTANVNTALPRTGRAEDTLQIEDANKDAVQGSDLPPAIPGDFSKEKENSKTVELVLATLSMPPKEDPKEKAKESSTAAST